MIDVRECRRNLEKRREARRRENLALWNGARRDAERLVQHIAANYRPRRIIQWGSVLDAERFGPRSDIDIAVKGDFPPEAWFRLLVEEIRKGMEAMARIEAFYDRVTGAVQDGGRDPEKAIVIADLLTKHYTCVETLFLRLPDEEVRGYTHRDERRSEKLPLFPR